MTLIRPGSMLVEAFEQRLARLLGVAADAQEQRRLRRLGTGRQVHAPGRSRRRIAHDADDRQRARERHLRATRFGGRTRRGDADCGASRRTSCPTPSPFGQSCRAMVSDTIATPASAVRSACVKPRPLTTSMPSTSKYSDDTASWPTGNRLDAAAPTSAEAGHSTRRRRDDAATTATSGWAVRAWSSAARRGSLSMETLTVSLVRTPGSSVAAAKAPRRNTAAQIRRRADAPTWTAIRACRARPRTRIPRHFAAHRRHQVEAGGLQRRCEPEEHRRHDGASHQEHQHPPVRAGGGKVEQIHELGDLRRQRRHRRIERALQKQPRDDKAACRRRERKEEALREQLPDDAPA